MHGNKITPLTIAVRAYPDTRNDEDRSEKRILNSERPDAMLTFDTETRTDATQRLMFGSALFHEKGKCMKRMLFYAEDISATELNIIRGFISKHNAAIPADVPELLLLTRREFLDELYFLAYKGHCLLVAFNFQFDISRVAFDVANARGYFTGGFSFGIWSYLDQHGCERRNQYRPRIVIKHIDSKRALKAFTAPNDPDNDCFTVQPSMEVK